MLHEGWFKQKYGYEVPEFDQYKMQATDSLDKLCELLRVHKDCKSNEFKQCYTQISDKEQEIKKRQRDEQREITAAWKESIHSIAPRQKKQRRALLTQHMATCEA